MAVLCLGFVPAWSQTGSVKGFIFDKSNGEPLAGASIGFKQLKKGAQSDVNGFFNIPRIPAGTHTASISLIGYEASEIKVTVTEDEITSVKIQLNRKNRDLKGISISARREEKTYDTKVGMTRITPKEMKMMPAIGGEADIAQYLQVMPGVVSTGDQGGQLYIRGGSPIQNKILLDGMTIYNPFHSIGLYSVFETDGIRSADVMSGGFGVEYGDRTSAIVSVTSKDGNKKIHTGKLAVNPILAKYFAEGPLMKSKGDSTTSITYVASLKHSYLQSSAPVLYGMWGEPYKTKLPYTFTDFYGKLNLSSGTGSKMSVFGFNFNDRVNYTGVSDLKWNNAGAGLNFVVTPGNSPSLVSGGFYYSDYKIGLAESSSRPRESAINGFDANISVSTYLPNHSELKYGIEIDGFKTSYDYYNFVGIKLQQNDYTTQLGGYLKLKKTFSDKLVLEPGLRFQYYASLPVARLEPRMAVKYNVTKTFRLKGSAGMYSQNIISSKSDRDIVNFFTGFLTSPDYTLYKPDGSEARNNIQKAIHFIGGVELDIRDFDFTAEPWYKSFTQLVSLNRYKLYASDPDFLIESGKAYGFDVTAKYAKGRTYFWAVYSYGYVDRFDGHQTYPTPFDRRHNVNVLASYNAGKKSDWEFSLRFNYGSAFPFTQTQAFVENINFNDQGIGTNYLTQNGTMQVIYSDKINGGRLTPYHRLDISMKKRIATGIRSFLEVSGSISNVYDRQNIFYIDRITNSKEYQLPVFPSLGISWTY